VRLFVALDLREEVRQAVREMIERLKPKAPGARWVRPEGMHITLKFIGHIDAAKLDAIQNALSKVYSPNAVELQFRGVGFFPNDRRPRVVWCGINASPNLARIAEVIEAGLEPIGIAREERAFSPHLTLARFNEPGRADELARAADELAERVFGSACETEFHLFESTTKPTGAVYKKLASFPFVKESH
jgi:RNA 2',3'-cyclic 3'-phosphodiesterase